MSESAARATRRDLRRAMGQAGLDRLVLHERAIAEHTERLTHLEKQQGWLKARMDGNVEGLRKELSSLAVQQGATFGSLAEFCGRSFWQRLRWLVTGR